MPKDVITYKAYLTNFGTKHGFDVRVNYDMIDSYGNIVSSSSETKYLETTMSFLRDEIAPYKPGKYSIRINVIYGKYNASSSAFFTVIGNKTTNLPKTKIKEQLSELSGKDAIDFCKILDSDYCYSLLALYSNNYTICKGASKKDACIMNFIINSTDTKACENIDEDLKESCLLIAKMNKERAKRLY